MLMRLLCVLILAATLVNLPMASAQVHDHLNASGVAIAHDLPPDGRTYIGNIAHFAVVGLGDDDVPDFHQQNHVRVTLNGVVLYETTPDSGHDYDGMYAFDVVFPVVGRYAVEALDGEMVLASFEGTVVEPLAGPSSLILEGPGTAALGELATFRFQTQDGTGAIVPHSDSIFEVRQGTTLVFRTKTHTHDEVQEVRYAFPLIGDYTVRVTDYRAYPSGGEALDFAPQTAEKTVTVTPGVPPIEALTVPQPLDLNAVVQGTVQGGAYTLVGTYDPYTVVGPFTPQRLSAVVIDPATRAPVQHVDFTARLVGPLGSTLFASETLHEYDGIFEVVTMQPLVGAYLLVVDAERGDWKGHVELPYIVAPPVVAAPMVGAAGPQLITVDGLMDAKAGVPMDLQFFAHDVTGLLPFAHSEIDLQILDAARVPVLATKIHTHDDGRFTLTFTPPAEGDYTLRLSPFPLLPSPTPVFYGANLGDPLDIPLHVAAGPGFPTVAATGIDQNGVADKESPASGPAAIVLLLAAIAVAATRRR